MGIGFGWVVEFGLILLDVDVFEESFMIFNSTKFLVSCVDWVLFFGLNVVVVFVLGGWGGGGFVFDVIEEFWLDVAGVLVAIIAFSKALSAYISCMYNCSSSCCSSCSRDIKLCSLWRIRTSKSCNCLHCTRVCSRLYYLN